MELKKKLHPNIPINYPINILKNIFHIYYIDKLYIHKSIFFFKVQLIQYSTITSTIQGYKL